MTISLEKIAKKKGIRFFLVSFTDLFGVTRSKLVPTSAIAGMQEDGAGFAGFAAHLDMTPADTDMFALPDPEAMIQLPWQPEVAWVPGDLFLGPNKVEHCPRTVLKKVLSDAKDKGYSIMSGVECEFFLLNLDGTAVADEADTRPKPCYDQQAVMRRFDFISEICDHMETLGWGPYQNDHEDANGQFEQNWGPAGALETADRHVFYKYMVKTLAEKHGFRATFMPKPIEGLTGNGTHCHVSVWNKTGKKNLMMDKKGELGLSDLAYHFIGGLLKHATAGTLITNPIVNSYKRINAPRTTSGATWAPNTVTYSGNNRTHMIRIPDNNRIEVRLADGATNPYLLQALVAGAGLHGVENKTNPGKRYDIDMYAEGHTVKNAPLLPLNMVDAMRLFGASKELPKILGEELCASYLKLKNQEWNEFAHHFSEWERQNGLDV
ncbi:MAG: type III glutamate--ammonia ligase [Hyphomicrobiales bacterium]